MKTIWESGIKDNIESLNQNIETEVLIIGGGICGILCAYRLSKAGKKVVLVEENQICGKKTKKTTAVITALQDVMYYDLIKKIGKENARLYLEANLEAIEEYKALAKNFNFDFEEVSSYKYSTKDMDIIHKELDAIKELGYTAKLHKSIDLPISIVGAIEFKNQAQMNPIKLINAIKDNFKIYENTKIIRLEETKAYTQKYTITAKNIVVCTGYPFLKLKGFYFGKLTQEKSYVMAYKTESKFKGNAIGIEKDDLYFRNYKNYLIVGGSQGKTGKTSFGYGPIRDFIKKYNNVIEYQWINQDCISLDSIPYIGKYGYMENVYVATGFNLWGMTGAMLSSILITDLILNKKNRYEELFSPHRSLKILPLLKNGGRAVVGLLTPKIHRCSHLGCALNWNEIDEVYECPCHGSKYDKDGNVLEGPGQKNI